MPLSLEIIGSQIEKDADNLIKVKTDAVSNRSTSKSPQWVFPATFDNHVNLDVIVIPNGNGFQFAINTGNTCTRVQDYSVYNLQHMIKRVCGIPAGHSFTRYTADSLIKDAANYVKNRNGLELNIRTLFTKSLEQDFGHGPKVVNSWVMDGTKDDYADFIFVVKGIRKQLPDFDIQLQITFCPESKSWAVYSQYLRNDDDRIFVDTDEISPETPDPLDNLRDYLENVVETGNKKYSKYMKKLESDE